MGDEADDRRIGGEGGHTSGNTEGTAKGQDIRIFPQRIPCLSITFYSIYFFLISPETKHLLIAML